MAKQLTVEDVEFVGISLAKEWMNWNEPIPDFSTRFPNKLESCLMTPFQTFGKRQLYRGLLKQASILFYLLIKNHPFQNGNKRIAVATLLLFLFQNKKWIKVTNQEIYNFSIWIAGSPPQLKDQVIAAIHEFIRKNMIEVKI